MFKNSLNIKKFILILIFFGLYLSSNAQSDNLEPEHGIFAGYPHEDTYYPIVKKILFDGLQNLPRVRIVVMASFSQEYLISVDRKNSETYLTYRIAKEQIWKNPKKDLIDCDQYQMKFDPEIANKLHELFFLAISKAKYPTNPGSGVDGTAYIFIAYEGGLGIRSGKTWSPNKGKLLGLVEITDWLVDCVKKGAVINQDEMGIRINKLIEKFKKE